MSGLPTTSRCGQMHHLRRQDVLTFYYEAQRRETPVTVNDFTIALAEQYVARVPAHARSLSIMVPDAKTMDPATYDLVLDRQRRQVERWAKGKVAIPAEIEESWAFALTPPYGERCRHELAWRYGFLGVMSEEADPCPDGEIMGRLLGNTGRATTALARALANQSIDYEDLTDGEIEADLAELERAVASIRSHVRAVRDRGPLKAPVIASNGPVKVRG